MRKITLSPDSLAFKNVINSLQFHEGGEKYIAIANSFKSQKDNQVEFSLYKKHEMNKPSFLLRWFKAVRPISLTATFSPGLAILIYFYFQNIQIHFLHTILAFLGVTLLHLCVNVLNDREDYLKLIDLPGELGGSGVIQKGWITPVQIKRFALGCLTLSLLTCIPLFMAYPLKVSMIVLASLVGGYGYSSYPFFLKYRALGDLSVYFLCGPLLLMGHSLAMTGEFNQIIWPLGSYLGFAACGILHANNLNDATVDKNRGAVTLSVKLGFKASQYLFVFFYFLAYFSLILGYFSDLYGLSPLILSLGGLIPIFKISSLVLKAKESRDKTISLIRFQAAQTHLLMSVLFIIGLIVEGY